ncbi:MAG: pyridoxamine 5'-phosphate oxidase family protein [Ilumatobacter sp.]|nr:pyridoxamine 5'-phosphate oxidase family protein [Ilumatobacter sp.]
MSIPVELADLRAKTAEYDWAYLLTVGGDLRPHIVAVTPVWEGDVLAMSVGRGTAANATSGPAISLCYPPVEPDGHSLIVDGTAEVNEQTVMFAPTGAVLHRPAPPGFTGSATGCGNDCEPVSPA